MRIKQYSSDLPAKAWQVIEKMIEVKRRSCWPLKDIVDGILYVAKNGCIWRDLPGEFPCWQTVYWYFRKWERNGTWKRINDCLVIDVRTQAGHNPIPSVAIVDSQSVKNSSTCTNQIGIDGGKLIKGRKRFFVVDTMGNLLSAWVCPANAHDGCTAAQWWGSQGACDELLGGVAKVFADGTFGGTFATQMKEQYDICVEIPKIPIAQKGAVTIHQHRWVVERSIAWITNYRRGARDYERLTDSATAFIIGASIGRLAKRI